MRHYIWQKQNWQDFHRHRDSAEMLKLLAKARFMQGELLGKINSLDLHLQTEAETEIIVAETVKTSKIEGVELNVESVRSSVAQRLGFPEGVGIKKDRNTDGVVEVLVDAVRNISPLRLKRLHGWHAALFPSGFSGINKINVGAFRKGDMQVVSGYFGLEKIHFEAPPDTQIKNELSCFIKWFNDSLNKEDGILRAASAHLKFVTIHPYDDGNGRLSRALTDMAMAQDEKTKFRSYSLSAEIMKERNQYYQILEDVQSAKIKLNEWYEWFLTMFIKAVENSQHLIASAFFKADFWNRIKNISINDRQRKVIQKMLAAGSSGIGGFEGGLTTRKYVSMTKTSPATAFREIDDLYVKGILTRTGQGRSVHYEIRP
jgi:Fic family protein